MDTKIYFRQQFNTKIRPIFIKDSCECCGSKEQLELHHNEKHFATLLNECHEMLGLEFKNDTGDYGKDNLRKLKLMMLGMQFDISYLTLCSKCHNEHHIEYGKDLTNYYIYIERKRMEKEINNKHRIEKIIIPFLESMIDTKVFSEMKDDFINAIAFKDNRGRLIRSYSGFNNLFAEKGLPYKIEPSRTKIRVDNGWKSVRYWEIIKLNNK